MKQLNEREIIGNCPNVGVIGWLKEPAITQCINELVNDSVNIFTSGNYPNIGKTNQSKESFNPPLLY